MSVVEAVARAMCRETGPAGFGATHGNYDEFGPDGQALWLGLAVAAIEALRDQTLIYRQDGDVVHEMRGAPDDIWKTLLDAALSTPSTLAEIATLNEEDGK